MYTKIDGLVIKSVKYKEKDALLTILTSHGRVFARAHRVMSKSSGISAACQLFALSEFVFSSSGDRMSIDSGVVKEAFMPLRSGIERLALASYIAELASILSDADAREDTEQLYRTVLNTLHMICRENAESVQTESDTGELDRIKAVFELRSLAGGGFAPRLDNCGICSRESDKYLLNINTGMLRCPACIGGTGAGINLPLHNGSLRAMRYVAGCDLKKLFSFTLAGEALNNFTEVMEAFTLSQFEQGFKTLGYYKSLRRTTGFDKMEKYDEK